MKAIDSEKHSLNEHDAFKFLSPREIPKNANMVEGRTDSGAQMAQAETIDCGSIGQMFMVEHRPDTYKAVHKDHNAGNWQQPIESEKRSIVQYDALVFLPPGEGPEDANVIKGKRVMQSKLNADGSTKKLKTRLVDRRDLHIEGVDYSDTISRLWILPSPVTLWVRQFRKNIALQF